MTVKFAGVVLDGSALTAASLESIANGAPASLCPQAAARMDSVARWYASRADAPILRRKWAQLVGGALPRTSAEAARTFVLGHCAGVGEPLPRDVVRALIAARVNVLAVGPSACRAVAAQAMLDLLDHDVIPVVPSLGDAGVGGSLALAHVVAVRCGWYGDAWLASERLPAAEALRRVGLAPFTPTEKEALSLVNGSTLATAMGALACARSRRLLLAAEAACGLSMEVVRADLGSLNERALRARGHQGAVAVAARLRAQLRGSQLATTDRAPDPFSVRCAPAALGAAWDTLAHVDAVITRELNGACDNPLVFPDDGLVVEGGNFHGAPVALAMDLLKAALTQVGSMAERRLFRLTYGQLSGLPSFLLPNSGLSSGLMLAQYTAASLVSECKGLSHPASVDSLPTVQHHEDHVSNGPIAADGALRIAELLADVVAIELLCAAQGLDFHLAGEGVDELGVSVATDPRQPGAGSLAVHAAVRALVPRWTEDRVLYPDLRSLGAAVRAGRFAEGLH